MQKRFRCLILAAAVLGAAAPAAAQEQLRLTMADGRVTLVAHEVPLRQLLAEWARVGGTTIVNGDKLVGQPVTLELVDYPEGRALDLVLRQAAGYTAVPRPANQPGVSVYNRILILPTSRPPAVTAQAAPPPFNRNVMPQPMPVPVEDDDDGEPGDQGPVPPPGMLPQPVPGAQPMPFFPGQQPQPAPVLTAPRPGMLPQPQPGAPNPYAPGVRQPPPGGRPGGEGQ